MSLNWVFNKLFFKKHKPGEVVASNGDKAFKKLTVTADQPSVDQPPTDQSPPITGLDPDNFNLGIIGLKPGTYTITATVSALGLRLAESDHSISIEYTVE